MIDQAMVTFWVKTLSLKNGKRKKEKNIITHSVHSFLLYIFFISPNA